MIRLSFLGVASRRRNSTTICLANTTFVILALLWLPAGPLACASSRGQVENPAMSIRPEETDIAHQFLQGTGARVKNALRSNPRGYRNLREVDGSNVTEDRPPPPACGLKVARLFLSEAQSRFNVPELDRCEVADGLVDCPLDYLPRYEKTYLYLFYEHVPRQYVELVVTAKSRSSTGSTRSAQLNEDDRAWLLGLFMKLVLQTECDR
jgi:hypothetical protein